MSETPKPEEAPKPVDAPKAPEAAEAAADLGKEKDKVKADSKEARAGLSAEIMERKVEDLPDSKYKQFYLDAKEQVENDPNLRGQPMASMVLAVAAFMAKFGPIFDNLSSTSYLSSISGSGEAFSDEEKEKIKAVALDPAKKPELKPEKIEDLKSVKGIETASTKYVALKLWGLDNISDTRALGAKLSSINKKVGEGEEEKVENFWEKRTYADIKKNGLVPNTVIIFAPSMVTQDLCAAYAVDKENYEFFDYKTKEVKKFKLTEPTSPLTSLSFRAAFEPRGAEFFGSAAPAAATAPADKSAEAAKTAEAEEDKDKPAIAKELEGEFDSVKTTFESNLNKLGNVAFQKELIGEVTAFTGLLEKKLLQPNVVGVSSVENTVLGKIYESFINLLTAILSEMEKSTAKADPEFVENKNILLEIKQRATDSFDLLTK